MLRKIAGKIYWKLYRIGEKIYWKLHYAVHLVMQFYNVFFSKKDMKQKRERHIFALANVGAPLETLSQGFQMSVEEIQEICRRRRENMQDSGSCKEKLHHWDLPEDVQITSIYPKVWQIGREHVLKLTYDVESAQKECRISEALIGDDFPYDFPRFYPTREGDLVCDNAMLMNRMPGQSIVLLWNRENCVEQMERIGAMLSRFHETMRKTDFGSLVPEGQLMRQKGMLMAFSLFMSPSLRPKLHKSYQILEQSNLERGCTHGDFHPGNLRFDDDGNLSGLLDFGNAQRDFFLDDVAYFMLQSAFSAGQTDDREKTRQGMEAFLRGYWGDGFGKCWHEQKECLTALVQIQCSRLMIFFKSERMPSELINYIRQSSDMLTEILEKL